MEKIKKSFSENKTFIITLLICIFLTSSSMIILLYRHNNSTSSSTDTSEIITEDTSLKDFEPYITELSKINVLMD